MSEKPTIPTYRREFHPNDSEVNFNNVLTLIEAVAGGFPTDPVIETNISAIKETAAGASFELEVAVETIDGQTISYQWQKAALGGTTFSNISSATTDTYTVAEWDDTANKGKYRCKIVNTVGSWTATIYSNICVATTSEAE